MNNFQKLFGKSKSFIIGMVHLRALPGSPLASKTISEIIQTACTEAAIYREAGMDGILIENMHDRPWLRTTVGPETTAAMAVVCSKLRELCPNIPIGVQVLAGANKEAIAIAKAANLNFIRAEGFVFSHIGDEGPMDSCAAELMRYRRYMNAENVLVFTDIKKKHSSHALTADVTIGETAKAAEMFLSDGVIVSGTATGSPTNLQDLKEVRESTSLPVLVGSGVTEENVSQYLHANGLIIGSHLKMHGHWSNDVDENLVHHFMKFIQKARETYCDVSPERLEASKAKFALDAQGA